MVARDTLAADAATTSPSVAGSVAGQAPGQLPLYVKAALYHLTRAERAHILRGAIGGDTPSRMIGQLQRKSLFYFHIDSPNGQCGFMRLTPLGVTVQSILKARIAKATGHE